MQKFEIFVSLLESAIYLLCVRSCVTLDLSSFLWKETYFIGRLAPYSSTKKEEKTNKAKFSNSFLSSLALTSVSTSMSLESCSFCRIKHVFVREANQPRRGWRMELFDRTCLYIAFTTWYWRLAWEIRLLSTQFHWHLLQAFNSAHSFSNIGNKNYDENRSFKSPWIGMLATVGNFG